MSRPQLAKLHHARSRLEDARFAFDHARSEMAVNRLYYALHEAAVAILYNAGESPRTHKGIFVRLYQLYVRTELLPMTLFRRANALRELRHAADYDYDHLQSHHVEPFIATVDRFIDWARKRGI